MFKKIIFSLLLLSALKPGAAQTAAEWQADLRHLQQTVHSKYNNLFHLVTKQEWDKAADAFYAQIPQLDKLQTLAGFIKLVAQFRIGHTQMNTWALHGNAAGLSLHRYPYLLHWFSDGLYVLQADKQYETIVGAKITKIGGLNTEAALEAIKPLVACENEQGFKSNCVYFMAIPEFLQAQGIAPSAETVTITGIKNGREVTADVKAVSGNHSFSHTGLVTPQGWINARKTGDEPLWQKQPAAYRYMELPPGTKTLYVRHSVTLNDGDKTIADFFKNMTDFIDKNDVEKLVLDIRMNGGGNNYLNKAIITSIIASRKINQKGKFYCVIGRRTFSAAQNLVNELEKYTEVIFVGEPTSENVNFYGDTRTETLPNSKLNVNLSWMWWQNMDPRDKRMATSPALAVDMSFSDYYNNIDPVMNVINTYGGQGPIEDRLRGLVMQGKYDEAVSMAKEYMSDPLHRYYKDELETRINDFGYNLMGQKQYERAAKVLYMNVRLFPQSANVYDSYAESCMLQGKNEEAVKYYEMAINKDTDGVTAENARKMIEKIKTGSK